MSNEKSMFFCVDGDVFSEEVIRMASDYVYTFECKRGGERGEYEVKLNMPVRGRNVFLLVSLATYDHKESANDLIMKTILMISALKNGDASKVTLVINNMCYLSNDLHRERSPLAIEDIITCFESVGADRIIFVDMHNQNWRMVGRTKKDDIRPRKIFSEDMKSRGFNEEELIFLTCPGCDKSKIESYRKVFPNAKYFLELVDMVHLKKLHNKKVIIVGDFIKDNDKVRELIAFLRRKRVKEIHAYITHSADINLKKLLGLSSLTVSNSLKNSIYGLPDDFKKIVRIIGLEKFIGRVLRQIDTNGSINKAE